MKNGIIKAAGTACALTLLFAASPVLADPISILTTPSGSGQNTLSGSDTLNEVMDAALKALGPTTSGGNGTLTQMTVYNGQGSGSGQNQLEGNVPSDQPSCTPTDADTSNELNPGCQEIAPMSRLLSASICDDDYMTPLTQNVSAEHLAICGDGLVVITDNKAFAQYAASGTCVGGSPPGTGVASPNEPAIPADLFQMNATYAGSGKLREAGTLPVVDPTSGTNYVIGDHGVAGWKDVLRVIFTGCNNTYSDTTCAAIPRSTRCSGTANPVRQALIDHWEYIVNSGAISGDTDSDCNGATANACAGGLRAAYRRDDVSGTTGVFLSMLSLGSVINSQRPAIIDGSFPPKLIAVSDTHMFCDGGDNEGYLRSTATGGIGDPIQKPCLPEDDLCIGTGSAPVMGVVRAIRSPLPAPGLNTTNYPLYQCTRGKFKLVSWMNVALPVCPDGTKPIGGKCSLPYYEDTSTTPSTLHYDCVNDAKSITGLAATADGRVYNFVMRDDAGNVKFRDGTTKKWPEAAQWRQNVRKLDTTTFGFKGGPWASLATTSHPEYGALECESPDATKGIGCVVSKTQCTVGFAGREAAQTDPYDDTNEAFYIHGTNASQLLPGGYVMFRDLYLSAIGGFENTFADCAARSPSGQTGYCADERAFVKEFYSMGPAAVAACQGAGFVPKKAPGVDPALDATRCVGAKATSGVACGADAVEPLTACDPLCGDGSIDTVFGETCDDGNHTNGDGCNANCLLETP